MRPQQVPSRGSCFRPAPPRPPGFRRYHEPRWGNRMIESWEPGRIGVLKGLAGQIVVSRAKVFCPGSQRSFGFPVVLFPLRCAEPTACYFRTNAVHFCSISFQFFLFFFRGPRFRAEGFDDFDGYLSKSFAKPPHECHAAPLPKLLFRGLQLSPYRERQGRAQRRLRS